MSEEVVDDSTPTETHETLEADADQEKEIQAILDKEDDVLEELPELSIEQKIAKGVAEALKPIKEKLNTAYSARDKANQQLAELAEVDRLAELERLAAEGKHKEVYELKLQDQIDKTEAERAKRLALESTNIKLTRDAEVKALLAELPFRSAKASNMAKGEIISQLVRDDEGVWKNKSGESLADTIESFQADESNSFLFKAKVTSGSGAAAAPARGTAPTEKKSLFNMSQDEVLKLAKAGKLPK